MKKLKFPAAPSGLPPSIENKWRDAYRAAFIQSRDNYGRAAGIAAEHNGHTSKNPAEWDRDGLCAANKLLATPVLASYEQAMSLEAWHFVLRSPSADGKTLRVVTRHGVKYNFPIPSA